MDVVNKMMFSSAVVHATDRAGKTGKLGWQYRLFVRDSFQRNRYFFREWIFY